MTLSVLAWWPSENFCMHVTTVFLKVVEKQYINIYRCKMISYKYKSDILGS